MHIWDSVTVTCIFLMPWSHLIIIIIMGTCIAHISTSKSAQSAVYKLSWNSNQLKQKYNTLYIIIIRMNGTFIIIIIIIINHL